MSIDKKWGIDLSGRKMRYEPWPTDQNGKYRNPSENEIEEIYSISGETIAETLQYFIECGGDVEKLLQMLNDHVIDDRFLINKHEPTLLLSDKTRWYNNEYYFYFIMFTKKVIGRYDFHFGENKDEQLSVYHKIYEKGFMDFIPWGVDENEDEIKDVSLSVILMLLSYSEEVIKLNIDDFIIFVNSNLSEIYNVDRNFFDNENIWCSLELIEYSYEFIKILNNNNSFLLNASYFGTFNKLKIIKIFSIFPNKFILSVFKLVAVKINNVHEFKIIHKTNSFKLLLSLKQNFNRKKYSKYLASSIKNDAFVWQGATAAAITTIYNLNDIPVSDLKINGYLENPSLEISYKWNVINTKLLFKIISGIILPFIPCYFFVFIKFLSLRSYFFISSFISIITSIIIYFVESKRVLNKKMIENLKVTNEQLLILEKTTSELLKEKQSLELKVIERTKQLEDANKQKTIFFVNLTHEIKTPLTLISNYFDKHIKKNGITEETKIIDQNLNKLKNDINNFMDAEKLESGQPFYNHNQIINLSNIINIKAIMFKEIAAKKNIIIITKIDENIHIKIDPYAIDRVINNLIDNAVKYSNEYGFINIILKNPTKNNVEFTIYNTGTGISKEDQKHIFEPYYQITHKKKNIQGIGMGLNIVKKIIDEIDAVIKIESELNTGTTFIINFKRYYLKENEEAQENTDFTKPMDNISDLKLKETVYKKQRQNILIVEDKLELLIYLQSELHDIFNIFIAENGKKALEEIENMPKPDLIISDIMMDEMDGYDFCKQIKKIGKYKNIPFIFLTAKTSVEDKKMGYIKGADDYITKPFNISELFLKIEKILERKNKIIKEINTAKEENINNKYKEYRITEQEQKIIDMVKHGKENKEIANELNITEGTVKNHLKNIFKKINIKTRIEILKFF